MDLNLFELLKK